jgi:hypothetical protein
MKKSIVLFGVFAMLIVAPSFGQEQTAQKKVKIEKATLKKEKAHVKKEKVQLKSAKLKKAETVQPKQKAVEPKKAVKKEEQ